MQAFDRRDRQDSVVRQAGHFTHRNQNRAAAAAQKVGENSLGIRWAWRSFQAMMRRSASFKHLNIGRAARGCLRAG